MRSAIAIAILAAASFGVTAAQPTQDHAAHHPPDAASVPNDASTPKTRPATAAQMDARMKAMREMHEKMNAAKSPEERQALMAEHMKAMQEGMAMMGQMKGPQGKSMPMNAGAMGQRMDMMEMMMQMMVDREAARMPAK